MRFAANQDIFLASLEELAYALAGVDQGTVQGDPLGVVRQLLQQPGNNGNAGGMKFCACWYIWCFGVLVFYSGGLTFRSCCVCFLLFVLVA